MVKIGTPSGLHFVWISVDLGSQVGAKLGRKIEPRQAKTGQDKGRQGKRREGKGKEEEGKGLEGKGVEKCGWGLFSPGGGGVRQTLRGRPPQGSGPRWSRGAVASYTVFLATLLPFFFASFFQCLFGSIFV